MEQYVLKSCPQITKIKSYGDDFLPSDIMQWEGHGITFVVFLPNKYKLLLTMGKQQINPNWETFYEITDSSEQSSHKWQRKIEGRTQIGED